VLPTRLETKFDVRTEGQYNARQDQLSQIDELEASQEAYYAPQPVPPRSMPMRSSKPDFIMKREDIYKDKYEGKPTYKSKFYEKLKQERK